MRAHLTALALAAATAPLTAQAIQTTQERPSIIVDGHAEVKSMPDVATISYTLRGEGQTSDDAVRAMVAMGNRIQAALQGLDAAAEPHSDKVQVTPVKPADCKESRDSDEGSPQLSTGSCAIVGYIATQDVTVRTADIKDAGTLVGLAGRGGAYDAGIRSFDLQDSHPAHRQAIRAALADAQTKAEVIAAGGGLKLGPVLRVSTPGGVIDRISAEDIGSLRRVPGVEMNAPPPVAVNVTPEPITTSENVTVTYAIGELK